METMELWSGLFYNNAIGRLFSKSLNNEDSPIAYDCVCNLRSKNFLFERMHFLLFSP